MVLITYNNGSHQMVNQQVVKSIVKHAAECKTGVKHPQLLTHTKRWIINNILNLVTAAECLHKGVIHLHNSSHQTVNYQ